MPALTEGALGQSRLVAYVVLGIVALYLGFTLVTRFHEGRCRVGGGRRGGLDCTFPAGLGDAPRR